MTFDELTERIEITVPSERWHPNNTNWDLMAFHLTSDLASIIDRCGEEIFDELVRDAKVLLKKLGK